MPVPSLITDLSTTAGSNSPSGSETPGQGDDHLRAGYAFIAQLRDKLNGTSATGTLTNANGTLAAPTITGGTVSGVTFAGTHTFGGNLTWGTYTPTGFAGNRITSVTPTKAQWMRIGNVVSVSGGGLVTIASSGTGAIFDLSTPFSYTRSVDSDVGGAFGFDSVVPRGYLFSNVSSRASFFFDTTGASGTTAFSYSYLFEIK